MELDFSPLLDANSILIKDFASKLRLDKTIQAEITSIEDVDSGKYNVKYEGNIFPVYSANLQNIYKVGKSVYVKIPEGDFTLKKFIEGEVSSKDISLTESSALMQSIEKIEPSWDVFYNNSAAIDAEYGLIAAVAPMQLPVWTCAGDDAADKKFQSYAKTFNKISIAADFKTELLGEHIKGNYGIEIVFRAYTYEDNVQVPKLIAYRLDLNNFIGNPYSLAFWTTQEANFTITDNLVGLQSISFFQEEFETDKRTDYTGAVVQENITDPNIFVKNIKLSFIDVVDYTDDAYHLFISAANGTILINPGDSLPLKGKLIYHGQDLMSENTCECTWYKENLSIMVGHEKYDIQAGARWEKIGNAQELTVNYSDVITRQKYKLRCVYNSKVVLEKEIEISQYNDDDLNYILQIEQINTENKISLQIKDTKNNNPVVANWYQLLVDNSYSKIGDMTDKVDINTYLLYNSITFFAEVYHNGNFIGNQEFTIFNSQSEDDIEVSFIELDKVYQYDVNGDITVEESELERTLQVRINWKSGYGASYKLTWAIIEEDGDTILTSSEYNPKDSMMKKIYVENNVVHYHLATKFNLNKTYNTFAAIIETPDGSVYRFEKEVLFLKDGDPGTNGTSYICVVRPVQITTDAANNIIATQDNGFHALLKGGMTPLTLKAFVYKDGVEIVDGDDYNISYNWYEDDLAKDASDNQYLVVSQGNNLPDNCRHILVSSSASIGVDYYVKVSVKIEDKRDTSSSAANPSSVDAYGNVIDSTILADGINKKDYIKTTTLNYHYPIPVFIGNADEDLVSINAPQYVMYTSSGLSAKFKDVVLSYSYDNVNKSDFLSISTFGNASKYLSIKDEEEGKKLFALTKFIGNEDHIASALICPTSGDNYMIYPIILYLNTYGNENINGWDGTSIKIRQDAYGRSGSFILAPQIGAGEKNDNGEFSGVVMGLDSSSNFTGLYGYKNGVNTFGLRDNGTAYFGSYLGGGRIDIDGDNATIEGNPNPQYGSSKMTLRLIDIKSSVAARATRAIEIKDSTTSPFYITYDGFVYAKNAQIEGNITATSGQIGNWYIDNSSKVLRDVSSKIILDPSNGISVNGGAFSVNLSGKLYCNDAEIEGTIRADDGTIGGWNINSTSIFNTTTTLSTNGIGTNGINIYETIDVAGGVAGIYYGKIGVVTGADGTTHMLGIDATGSPNGRCLIQGENVRMTGSDSSYITATNTVKLMGNTLECDFTNYKGIYATLA